MAHDVQTDTSDPVLWRGHAHRGLGKHAWLLVVATGLWTYHNSFGGPFIFDDRAAIVDNPYLRHLWPPWELMADTIRPITDLSFAVNYALGGLNVWGYHVVNLAIHLFAGLVLFGVVRRTLLSKGLRDRYGGSAPWLALTVALLWVVHPLQTASVTYIVQRAEALMGLFYFLTLYCVIRGVTSGARGRWYTAAVVSCALGMGSKPVMVTAPIVVLLYDRMFLAKSFLERFRLRWGLYTGLAATWGIPAMQLRVLQGYEATVGFDFKDITPKDYALTQPGVILHYVRLAIWPDPLVLDYAWPVARTLTAILLPAVTIIALLALTLWALRHRSGLGFLGAWFFLILAPTSSLIPVADPAFEHRMYLPLAAVVAFIVLGGHRLLRALLPLRKRLRPGLATGLVVATVTLLGIATVQRNADYQSEVSIWSDTLVKRPRNYRAHVNLGKYLALGNRLQEAIAHYTEALRLKPDYAEAHNNLGAALVGQGKIPEAIAHYAEALRLRPHEAAAHNNLGLALAKQGRSEEAITHYTEALRLKPHYAEAHSNLGLLLVEQGKLQAAMPLLFEALRLKPDLVEAHNNCGIGLAKQGQLDEAIKHYVEALRLKPDYAEAHQNLGLALSEQGKFTQAITHYKTALQLKPDYGKAHYNLGVALARQGAREKAVFHYSEYLRLQPDHAEAHNNLGIALVELGELTEAIDHYLQALRFKPDFAGAHYNLANALEEQGRLTEAVTHYTEALRLTPDLAEAHNNLGVALAKQNKLTEAVVHFSEAIRLKPDYVDARKNLAQALAKQEKTQVPAAPVEGTER